MSVDVLHSLAAELEALKDGTVPRDESGVVPSPGVRDATRGSVRAHRAQDDRRDRVAALRRQRGVVPVQAEGLPVSKGDGMGLISSSSVDRSSTPETIRRTTGRGKEHVRCDSCSRLLLDGERYIESLIARRVVGQPPPVYAAKLYTCEACDA